MVRIMACHCRTTALRLFVRGFAQLHTAGTSPATAPLRQSVRPAAQAAPPVKAYRGLHSAPLRRRYAAETVFLSPRDDTATKKSGQAVEERSGQQASQIASSHSSIADLTLDAINVIASGNPASEPSRNAHSRDSTIQKHGTERHTGVRRDKGAKPAGKRNVRKHGGQDMEGTEGTRPPAAKREPWQAQKAALKAKFGGEGWRPRKRLSPDALAGIRALHDEFPEVFTTEALAAKFGISPEAVRRILKSRWTPSAEEEEEREERWFRRGKKIWERNAELGMKPPRRWRDLGIKKRRRTRTSQRNDVDRLDSPYRTRRTGPRGGGGHPDGLDDADAHDPRFF